MIINRIESIDAKLCEESENLKKLNVKILQFDETGSVANQFDCFDV